MRIVDKLLNTKEQMVLQELQSITEDSGLKVFPTQRMAEVLKVEKPRLSDRVFDFYTRSHFDFVITDHELHPIMVVEYDGPFHANPIQQERDAIKNDLCKQAGLGMLRISDQHVTKHYRGISILRWIVEIKEFEKSFYEAQEKGSIRMDEPFDPLSLFISGKRRFPNWLSVNETIKLNKVVEKPQPGQPKGWHTFHGNGPNDSIHNLSCLFFNNQVLHVHTSVAQQDVDFPHYDLASEISICELGLRYDKFLKGEVAALTPEQFRPKFDAFCEKYSANPSSSRGTFPLNYKWDLKNRWQPIPPKT